MTIPINLLPFRRALYIAFFLFASVHTVCAQQKELLTNKSIIDLTKAGLGADVIESKINASNCKFDLSSNGLILLKKQGVNDEVITAMMGRNNTTNSAKATGTSGNTDASGKSNSSHITMVNHVYAIQNNNAVPLEKQVAGIRTKMKALGYGGASSLLQISGKQSSIRLTAAQAKKFLINTGNATPELVLYKTSKDSRQAESMRASMMGMKTGQNVITFSTALVKDGVYEIIIDQPLESGEYFFTGKQNSNSQSVDAFAFGID